MVTAVDGDHERDEHREDGAALAPRRDAVALVVEEVDGRVLDAAFSASGFTVRHTDRGATALQLASALEPDLVLLGLDLPDLDGIDVCTELRRWSAAPIIVVTVDDREHRKVAAFDAGADDYVVAPFSIPELLARVRRALRRNGAERPQDRPAIVAGPLRIDTAAHVATIDGVPLRLTAKEFALLEMLARSPQQLTTYRTLLTGVWSEHGRIEHLRARVNSLRRKLEAASEDIGILTEPGAGYRLVHCDRP